MDDLAESVDVSVSGTSAFEQGQIDDNGNNSSASPTYYMRTPADSPIPILNGQTMNLTFTYKKSTGAAMSVTNTRIYKYLDGVYVSRVQTTAKTAVVECDGTFNQLRIRAYGNGIGSSYPYCSVNYNVEKTLRSVSEQVDTNTADITSIATKLQDTSLSVEGMEAQTTNKRMFVASDAENGYFNTGEMFYVPKTYERSVRLKIEVHPGDHAIIYGKGGGNGAASVYALVDKYRRVLSKAGSGSSLSTPLEVDITEDCYLLAGVYTNLVNDASQFKVVITSNIKARVDALMNKSNRVVAPKFWNLPFSKTKDTIKVLSLGNSFAQDGSQYLDRLMTAAGVDASKYCYYFTFESGATLAGYVSWYKNGRTINCIDKNDSYTSTPRAGNIIMTSSGSLKTIISQDWDVIVLQQASTDAWNWDTYQPYLTELIGLIKRDCPNATIAWYHTWRTHSGDETVSVMPAQKAPRYEYRFDMLIDNVKKVKNEIGIDIIIPVGTAIENIRSTSFNDSKDMMRDDKHLKYGVPMYVAGCTWMDTIFAPILGKSCLGNTLTIGEGTDTIPVTDDNKLLCQQCAHAAVMNMFEVTTGLEPDVPEETTEET